jgi:multiple antibiotic resistance protein
MELFSAVVTLFLVMDTLGNDPLFLGLLKTVAPERRRIVLLAKSRWRISCS